MSIFDDTPSRPSRTSKHSSSLFDDDAPARNSASLFADDAANDADSPWSFPTPKRAARSALIKTLLPASAVPEWYIDVYDRLLAWDSDNGPGGGPGGGIDGATVRKMLNESGLDGESKERITRILGVTEGKTLGQGEVNVLVALVGLAQEGEDITLDGVDERRKTLPTPELGLFTEYEVAGEAASAPGTEAGATAAAPPSSAPIARPETGRSAPNVSQPRNLRKASFGFPDADPWGSPEMHRGHDHAPTNGNSAPSTTAATAGAGAAAVTLPQRTTSAFTTTSQSTSSIPDRTTPTRQSTSSDGGWGFNGGPNDTFRDPNQGAGFGDQSGGGGGGGEGPNHPSGLGGIIAPRLGGVSAPEEVITVNSLPEKEGMFFFQHRNYQVTSARRNSKVIRRYSDFVWLLDCLHKRYPFRQLPLLPPKSLTFNGNYLAADASFVEKRRRGLARFSNALVRHPVLSQEQLVIMFFTVPTELAVWRKQATISVQEEFTGKQLPVTLEDSLPSDLQDLFDRVRAGVKRSAEQYINLCSFFERLVKRNEGQGAEFSRVSQALQSLTNVSSDTYAADTGDILRLNLGLNAAAKHLTQSQGLLDDEARAWDAGVLEDLKKLRDTLVSMRDMFDRRERYDRDNIPQLERRIKANEEKLLGIRSKPEALIKPGEAERVEEAIFKDKQSIVDQHARGVFVKECIRDEILHFQSSQWSVSRTWMDWAGERVKYTELQAENWRQAAEEVECMPLGEES